LMRACNLRTQQCAEKVNINNPVYGGT